MVSILREQSRLALSLRNQYLTEAQRDIAPQLQQVLQQTVRAIKDGQDVQLFIDKAVKQLTASGFNADYLEL